MTRKEKSFLVVITFSSFKIPPSFPNGPRLCRRVSLFYINCLLLNCAISISSRLQPLSLWHSFLHQSPRPTFHLFLWGSFSVILTEYAHRQLLTSENERYNCDVHVSSLELRRQYTPKRITKYCFGVFAER